MMIYKVIGRTSPVDWAQSARDVELGVYKTLKGAQKHRNKLELDPEFYMDWKYLRIVPVKLGA